MSGAGPVRVAVAAKPKPGPARAIRPKATPHPQFKHALRPAALVQPALKVGPANDPLEREAETTSERIVSMAAPSMEAPLSPSIPQAQRAGQEDQPNTDAFEQAPPIPSDHQDPAVPPAEDVDTEALNQDEFAEIEDGAPDDPAGDVIAPDRNDTAAAMGPEGGAAPPDVARAVAQPGAGRPLPTTVRSFMEPRFGVDFSGVRIHDTASDRRTAARIGARAFTHRGDIWMGEGETVENRRLMAHELTHVVQQTDRGPAMRETSEQEPELQRGYLANKAEKYARNVPGYTLLTVILGRSPITGNKVSRNAENLVGGFLGLLPGGEQIFQRLKETKALQKAFDWVSGRLAELNITWSRIKGLVSDFIDEMPAWSPIKIAKRIFGPLVRDIITFISDIKDKILEFIVRGALALAGPYGEKVWGVIEKVKDTISMILADPLGFAKNLVSAVVKGFKQFHSRIGDHIKKGLMGWLFGTMQGAGIEMPEKLDFRGLMSIGLQILGLTYAKFRAMLVKRLGKNGEKKVAFLEKSVEVVKILLKEGFLGVWQRFLEMVEGFKTTVIDGIRKFVIETLVMGALSWVAGLSNPVGAVVKVALAIYNMIKAFLERLDQIIDLANAIFSSIGAIAKGQVKQAADFIEKTIAATIPVVLAFVAALIPVTGITKTIKGIIKKLQAPVEKALKKMVAFLVKKAKKLFSKVLAKINKKRKLPGYGFKVGEEDHALMSQKKGGKFQLMIASTPRRSNEVQQELAAEAQRAKEFGDDAKCVDMFEAAFAGEIDEAEIATAKVKPEQKKTSTQKPASQAADATQDAATKLSKLGPCLESNLFIDTDPDDGAIIRAREPRLPEIEGDAGTHFERGKITAKKIKDASTLSGLGARGEQKISSFYENDHIPEKSLGALVKDYVTGELAEDAKKGRRRGAGTAPAALLGEIDTRELGADGQHLPAITVYRPSHRQKTDNDAADRDHSGIINAAKAKRSLNAKIATLREGIQTEMKSELKSIADLYSADEAATKLIRGKLRKGLKLTGTLNKTLYGVEPGRTPGVAKTDKADGKGSELPLSGDPAAGVPDFNAVEGQKKAYSGQPAGFGKYIEFDHVVEAILAEKARDLKVGEPLLAERLGPAIDARVDGMTLSKAAKAERRTQAHARLKSLLTRQVFAGKGVTSYSRDNAETVALYRPVHREVSAEQPDVRGSILKSVNLEPATQKLAEYLVFKNDSPTKLAAGLDLVQAAVKGRIEGSITTHIALTKKHYQIEMKDFVALNQSKQAVAQMTEIVSRVGSALRDLRTASIDAVS